MDDNIWEYPFGDIDDDEDLFEVEHSFDPDMRHCEARFPNHLIQIPE
jgi:hypothetical protein